MPASHTDWTVDMVHALPEDGNRYEVIDGELLVTPAPSFLHQDAVLRLAWILGPYADRVGLWLTVAPAAVRLSSLREVQPDILALPKVNGRRPKNYEEVGRLILAVEVLSPSSELADREKKRPLYQSIGASEYWIVDSANRCIERWRPSDDEAEVLFTAMSWQPVPGQDPLSFDLPSYFRAVNGE